MAITVGLEQAPQLILATLCFLQTLVVVISRLSWDTSKVFRLLASAMFSVVAIYYAAGIELNYWAAACFFILVGSFNLLLVSQLWKLIAESLREYGTNKTYYRLAIIGGVGGIASSFAVSNVDSMDIIFLIGAVGLLVVILLTVHLDIYSYPVFANDISESPPINQSSTRLFTSFVLIHAVFGSFFYFWHVEATNQTYEIGTMRTAIFAYRDMAIGILTLVAYLLLMHKSTLNLNVWKLASRVPVAVSLQILLFLAFPGFEAALFSMVIFRSGNYAIIRPAREYYYAENLHIGTRKTFVDTIVFRSGDLLGALIFTLTLKYADYRNLIFIGMLGLSFVWFVVARRINNQLNLNRHEKKNEH